MPPIGVVGLGNMGLGMAATLVQAGFEVAGFDLAETRRDAAAGQGVQPCPTLDALFAAADTLLFSLPAARDVEAVVTAPGSPLHQPGRRVLVIDTSTSDPVTTRRLAALLHAAGHALIDAPVSGGPSGAAAGTLTMMVGGTDPDVAQAMPVLQALSSRVVHVGPSGAGNVAKLVNNMLVAAHLIAAGEAMRLSQAAGLPAEDALRVVNTATGRSVATEAMLPRWVLTGAFDSGFSAGLMRKDVRLALEMAAAAGVSLPLCTQAAAEWASAPLTDDDDFTRIAAYQPL